VSIKHDGFEALCAENTQLTQECIALRAQLAAIRRILDMPRGKAQALCEWHALLDKQDREREPGELPDFAEFLKGI
jgi:hypothetical protein